MTGVVPSRQGTTINNKDANAASQLAKIQSHRSKDLLQAIGLGPAAATSLSAVDEQQARLMARDLEDAEAWQRPLIEYLYEVAYQSRNGGRRRVNSSSNGQSHASNGHNANGNNASGNNGNGNNANGNNASGNNGNGNNSPRGSPRNSPRNSVRVSPRNGPPPVANGTAIGRSSHATG